MQMRRAEAADRLLNGTSGWEVGSLTDDKMQRLDHMSITGSIQLSHAEPISYQLNSRCNVRQHSETSTVSSTGVDLTRR